MNRKITFTLIFLFLLAVAESLAQKHPQLQYISLEAGLNMSGIRSAGHYDNHAKNLGTRVSFSAGYSFCDFKSLGASLSFDQKGASDPIHRIVTNLNYLTIPVYFRLATGKDPKLFIAAGGYFSNLISASRKGEVLVEGNTIPVNNRITSEFNRFDAGVTANGGMILRLYDDFDFMISAGISSGLMRIEDIPESRPKNYRLNISAGYIYYIGFR